MIKNVGSNPQFNAEECQHKQVPPDVLNRVRRKSAFRIRSGVEILWDLGTNAAIVTCMCVITKLAFV